RMVLRLPDPRGLITVGGLVAPRTAGGNTRRHELFATDRLILMKLSISRSVSRSGSPPAPWEPPFLPAENRRKLAAGNDSGRNIVSDSLQRIARAGRMGIAVADLPADLVARLIERPAELLETGPVDVIKDGDGVLVAKAVLPLPGGPLPIAWKRVH